MWGEFRQTLTPFGIDLLCISRAQDYIDATYASREEWILQSVLPRDEIVLEENKFPYVPRCLLRPHVRKPLT